MFELHPQLQNDTLPIGRFDLSLVLLHRDSQYPWCILVPARPDITEIYQLSEDDQQQLWKESAQLSRAMAALFKPDKLNVAAIGNLVPQLHVHHVARFRSDPTWPRPIWGALPAKAYEQEQLGERVWALKLALGFNPEV